MNTKTIKLYYTVFLLIFCSCGGDNDPEESKELLPTAASLSQPIKDEVCLSGISINENQSELSFIWQAAQHTDKYEIVVKNLSTEEINTHNTTQETIKITLIKGEPYSWYIVSKANNIKATAKSDIWKFYLAGDGIVNYAPFPAEVISPKMGSSNNIDNGTFSLNWKGTDTDNDISNYKILFDTVSPPITRKGETTVSSLNVTVENNTVYYWQVKTIDVKGNSSYSEIFQFKVN